ncbi:hypothetical protein CFC21_103800 [Triticum aestivum]|uniref:Uncharacterized protein n=3 Tax=Triticum TaxID=4564 RepID=A0A9R1A574_TRITD|nr:uncharacterized protein LOC123155501 [Triticum aestivum]KAF7102717.1 hypothetical protein CFC21_103800 [Triticum aestivum]VAI89735.1 unnamed protein product [Triticum turgidum subsp. durum]
MERSRSYSEKSSGDGTPASAVTELRCYSASYVTPKKAAGTAGWPPCTTASSSASAAAAGSKARSWSGSFRSAPAELRRKRRVAGYRVYGVEGKMKVSLKNGVRWLKGKCTQVVDGIW